MFLFSVVLVFRRAAALTAAVLFAAARQGK
jgi:hypothetical protein